MVMRGGSDAANPHRSLIVVKVALGQPNSRGGAEGLALARFSGILEAG